MKQEFNMVVYAEFTANVTVRAESEPDARHIAARVYTPTLTDNVVDTTDDRLVNWDCAATPTRLLVGNADYLSNKLSRLAMGEVFSEHDLLNSTDDSAIAKWFDFVVDNGIALHDDPRLTDDGQPYFVVCEQYENTPLCDALQTAYGFAETVAKSLSS